MAEMLGGPNYERSLGKEDYFTDVYFSMPQLCSFAHQIHHSWHMRPKSVVEIGVGNGFVSTFLRQAGIPVTTVDINPALEPDICTPLSELSAHLERRADLVLCCEVLEHMPLEELDLNLGYLQSAGDRLFLTLPNINRNFGFGGVANIPKLGKRLLDFNFDIPYKRRLEGSSHFWEVGSNGASTRDAIVRRLKKRYRLVKSGRFALNPYHIWFECQ